MPDLGGPYLQAAAFCERVLQEQDGVLSLIRVVDRITHSPQGPDVPRDMPPVPINLWIAVTLKSGAARGRHTLRIVAEAPSGQQLPQVLEFPVLFEGEDRGINVLVQYGFQAEMEGLYWFDVRLDDNPEPLTRMPLRVVYQPIRVGT